MPCLIGVYLHNYIYVISYIAIMDIPVGPVNHRDALAFVGSQLGI